MLNRFGQRLIKFVKTSDNSLNYTIKATRRFPLSQNTYYFSQTSQQKILSELNEQILYYKNNLREQDMQNKDYFIRQGWQIVYDPKETLYSFTKLTAKFDVKIFTHVKADPLSQSNEDEESYLNANKGQQKVKYAQLLIWIKKRQAKKWMVSELKLLGEQIALTNIHFTEFAPGVGWQKYVYAGPDIVSLPPKVMGATNSIFQKLGLKIEILTHMVYYASGKANQLDYKWFQSFKQIVS